MLSGVIDHERLEVLERMQQKVSELEQVPKPTILAAADQRLQQQRIPISVPQEHDAWKELA